MNDLLREAISTSHRSLNEQSDVSAAAVSDGAPNGEVRQKTDEFIIHTCRHVSAVCDVILPAVRKDVPAGNRRTKEYVRQVRRLERSIAQVKGRMYGQSYAAHLPWARVWERLGKDLGRLMLLEQAIIADLADEAGLQVQSALAARLLEAETTSPTRPHPYSPHTGRFAHLSRRLWTRVDSFWDTAEGRIVSGAAKVVKRPRIAS